MSIVTRSRPVREVDEGCAVRENCGFNAIKTPNSGAKMRDWRRKNGNPHALRWAQQTYSYLKATMGSTRIARCAGM